MAYTTIDEPEAHFQVKTYSGTGSSHAVTLDGENDMQPDVVWIKERNDTNDHNLFDASRGAGLLIRPNRTNAESSTDEGVKSFDSNGFTLGTNSSLNGGSSTYVAWCWKANGAGSANTDGNTNTTKTSANTTAGFSVIMYDGDGAAATLGHGLGVKPHFILQKNLDDSEHWQVQHKSYGATHYATLSSTNTFDDLASRWDDTEPTTSLITVGTDSSVSQSGENMVMYAWAPIQGFSKFGKYISNAHTSDGPFVYLGFRAAWIMVHRASTGGKPWVFFDNKRDGYNPDNQQIITDGTSGGVAEYANDYIDICASGFRIRDDNQDVNKNAGETYIYAAFAEAPVVNSNGVAATAR